MIDDNFLWIVVIAFSVIGLVGLMLIVFCIILPKNNIEKRDTVSIFAIAPKKTSIETAVPSKYGEEVLCLSLKHFKEKDYKVLTNLYLPKSNGHFSEIDAVLICDKCIFVIENKNYGGTIYGDGTSEKWTQILGNNRRKYKTEFYNPVHQNSSHIKWLKEIIGDNIPVYSLIVFSNRSNISNVSVKQDGVYIINQYSVTDAVLSICSQIEKEHLTVGEINKYYDKLFPYTQVSEDIKSKHIKQIRNAYALANQDAPKMICPYCGNDMVLRVAKNGPTVGQKFYGCKSFPKCRYTVSAVKRTRWCF